MAHVDSYRSRIPCWEGDTAGWPNEMRLWRSGENLAVGHAFAARVIQRVTGAARRADEGGRASPTATRSGGRRLDSGGVQGRAHRRGTTAVLDFGQLKPVRKGDSLNECFAGLKRHRRRGERMRAWLTRFRGGFPLARLGRRPDGHPESRPHGGAPRANFGDPPRRALPARAHQEEPCPHVPQSPLAGARRRPCLDVILAAHVQPAGHLPAFARPPGTRVAVAAPLSPRTATTSPPTVPTTVSRSRCLTTPSRMSCNGCRRGQRRPAGVLEQG